LRPLLGTKNALGEDPLCGFAFTQELVRDIFVGFVRMRDPALEGRIPKTLPVLVIFRAV
jgi:hypothetical protein